jgi:CspA family cold shock protein
MPTGTVKFFNETKGFGSLREKDKVQYEEAQGRKGPNAVKVALL